MKNVLSMSGLVVVLSGLILAGCYTQVSSTREDMFSDEYANQETETPYVSDDSTGTDEYFDENGLPRDRYYFDSYYPSMTVGLSWYDPYWYGYGGWGGYGGWYGGYYPPYGGYYPPYYCYYPSYSYYDGYGVTRQTGSTRGRSGDSRNAGTVRGGTVEPARGGGAVALDLPTARKTVSSDRATKATKPRTSAARATTSRSGEAARKENVKKSTGSTRSGSSKSSGQVRQPRRPSKTAEGRAEQQTRGNSSSQPSVRSSGHSAPASPPASSGARGGGAPSGGTSGGGGGARGGGGGRR